jgi:hypothetical protein
MTCIVHTNSDNAEQGDVKVPAYINTVKDITDKDEFRTTTLARLDYKSHIPEPQPKVEEVKAAPKTEEVAIQH